MKGLPLPFNFEGKGVLNLERFAHNFKKSSPFVKNHSSGDTEPTSVLGTVGSHSPPASSSTLSSSLGGGNTVGGRGGCGAASTERTGVAAVSGKSSTKWHPDATSSTSSQAVPQSFEMGDVATATTREKCSLEEWDSVLPESVAASPSQEQNILQWIMGDVDDTYMANLNKALQISGQEAEYEFNGEFRVVDQTFGGDFVGQGTNFMPNLNAPMSMSSSNLSGGSNNCEKAGCFTVSLGNVASNKFPNPQNQVFQSLPGNVGSITFNQGQQQVMQQALPFGFDEMKPPFVNPQVLIGQQQTEHPENPTFFMPLPFGEQEENLLMPPLSKRQNRGPIGGLEPGCQIPKVQFLDTGQDLFKGRNPPHQQHQQQALPQGIPYQLQLLPHYLPATGLKSKIFGEDAGHCYQQQQQVIVDQLYKAMDSIQTGNPSLARMILARLNHQLSPVGKPFFRAAFFLKEGLQLLLNANNLRPFSNALSPSSLILKVGAYKSFSDVSPIVQFANFTCNQALLEVLEGCDRIHIIDFDIGYGVQWASFIQELALRSGGAASLKITAFSSPSFHDQLELGLTRENLKHFASETGMTLEFEIVSIEALSSASWSPPFRVSENEAIGVNLPLSSFASCQFSMPLVLQFVKQLSPKIVVSVATSCDRTDLPFPYHMIHALQSYSDLLESVDAVNVNLDSLQKIERFLIQPGIEKILLNRYHSPDKTQYWRTLFLTSGLSPMAFSSFTESLAECVVKRTPARGLHVEKRQSSLVLCWQRKELISASAWRC